MALGSALSILTAGNHVRRVIHPPAFPNPKGTVPVVSPNPPFATAGTVSFTPVCPSRVPPVVCRNVGEVSNSWGAFKKYRERAAQITE